MGAMIALSAVCGLQIHRSPRLACVYARNLLVYSLLVHKPAGLVWEYALARGALDVAAGEGHGGCIIEYIEHTNTIGVVH